MTKAARDHTLALPNASDIVPGQSDDEVAVFLIARLWLDRDETGAPKVKTIQNREAARAVYGGILGRTAPKQEDYDDARGHRLDHDAWRAACTDLQRVLLEEAAERAREKRRSEGRDEYRKKQEKLGKTVRSYERNTTEEQQKEKNRERQKRFQEKMSTEERKEKERLRKAAQRDRAKNKNASGAAIETHTRRSTASDDSQGAGSAKASQRPAPAVSDDQAIEGLRKELQFTPEELAEIEAHKEFD